METISHQGLVTQKENDDVTIHLLQDGECHSCRMKDFCGVTDEDRNTFIVTNQALKVGDIVQVAVKPSTGFLAMFWAYFFPFILIVVLLLLGDFLGWEEWLSGSVALVSVVPYYLTLTAIRHFFKKSIQLDVHKL